MRPAGQTHSTMKLARRRSAAAGVNSSFGAGHLEKEGGITCTTTKRSLSLRARMIRPQMRRAAKRRTQRTKAAAKTERILAHA